MKASQAIGHVADKHWFIAPAAFVVAALLVFGSIHFRSPPFEVVASDVTPVVAAGGKISVIRHLKWLRSDCPSVLSQAEFLDSLQPPRQHITTLQHYGDLYPQQHFDTEWQIGYTMPWGETAMINRLSYSCFPFYSWWPVRFEMPQVRFTVTPAKP